MVDEKTKQFVEFKRVNALNEWLRLYGDKIIIDAWQTVKRNDIGVTYIVQFHLNLLTVMQIENEKNLSCEDQLNYLLEEAYKLQ